MTSEKRIKLAKFSQAVLAGNTQKKAALIAGVKDSPSIDVTASKMIREPQVIRAIDAALNRAGASLDKSARVIAEAHGANIVKVFNDNGEMTYSKPLADHVTRMKAAELNLKARGLMQSLDDGSGQVVGIGFFVMKGLKDRGIIESGGAIQVDK